jgi:hypothetical protein
VPFATFVVNYPNRIGLRLCRARCFVVNEESFFAQKLIHRSQALMYFQHHFLNFNGSKAAPLSVYSLFTGVGLRIVWIT